MIFATRDVSHGSFDPQGLPEIVLTGLDPDAARALLDSHLGVAPAEDVTDRLIVETGGNPLALLELPSELSRHSCAGRPPAGPAPPPWPRGAGLPRPNRRHPPVQSLLLLASADDTAISRAHARGDGLGMTRTPLAGRLSSGCWSRTRPWRSDIRWCAPRSTRRPRVGDGGARTEPWQRLSPAAGPGPRGLASRVRRRRARTPRWSPPSSSPGRVRSDVAAMSRHWRRTNGRRQCRAIRSSVPGCFSRRLAARGRVGQAGRARPARAARDAATDPLLLCDIARLRGHIELNIGSAVEAHRSRGGRPAAHDLDPRARPRHRRRRGQ